MINSPGKSFIDKSSLGKKSPGADHGPSDQPKVDRLDFCMAGLFGTGLALAPISRVGMAAVLVPAVLLLLYKFLLRDGFEKIWGVHKTGIGFGISLVFGWFAFTSVFSIDAGKSFQVTLRSLAIITSAAIFYQYVRPRRGLARLAMNTGLAVFVIWGGLGLYFIYFDAPLFKVVFHDWFGITDRLIFYKNDIASSSLFLAIALYFLLQSRGVRRWIYILSVIFLLLFIHAGDGAGLMNRAAITGNAIGLIGAVLLVLSALLPALWRCVTVILLFASVLIGTILVMENLAPIDEIGDVPAPTLPYPDHHRQVIWSFVYEKFKQNPVLGVGIDGIAKTKHANTRLADFSGQEYVPAHPHNWILEVAVETGIAGIVLVLSVMGLLLLHLQSLFRQKNMDKTMIFAIFYFFCSFWTISMVAFSIWSAWWLISFFMAMAMMLAVVKETDQMALKP